MKKKPKYGFASPNYDPEAKRRAQSKGGKNGKGGGRPRKVNQANLDKKGTV